VLKISISLKYGSILNTAELSDLVFILLLLVDLTTFKHAKRTIFVEQLELFV
jgi:hypothetical protein